MNKTLQDKAALEFQQRWTAQGYETVAQNDSILLVLISGTAVVVE